MFDTQIAERALFAVVIILATIAVCKLSYNNGIADERLRIYTKAQCTCTITETDGKTKHIYRGNFEDNKAKQYYAEN